MKATQLNSVTLRGVVGDTKAIKDGGRIYGFRFQLATNLVYRNLDGIAVVETTWHTCQYYDIKAVSALIEKGDFLEVIGRLHQSRFTRSDGSEAIAYDVVATQLHKIDGPLEMQAL